MEGFFASNGSRHHHHVGTRLITQDGTVPECKERSLTERSPSTECLISNNSNTSPSLSAKMLKNPKTSTQSPRRIHNEQKQPSISAHRFTIPPTTNQTNPSRNSMNLATSRPPPYPFPIKIQRHRTHKQAPKIQPRNSQQRPKIPNLRDPVVQKLRHAIPKDVLDNRGAEQKLAGGGFVAIDLKKDQKKRKLATGLDWQVQCESRSKKGRERERERE